MSNIFYSSSQNLKKTVIWKLKLKEKRKATVIYMQTKKLKLQKLKKDNCNLI